MAHSFTSLLLFLTNTLLLSLAFGCGEKYPEAYGVYMSDAETSIAQVDLMEHLKARGFTDAGPSPSVDFNEYMKAGGKTDGFPSVVRAPGLSFWFFDPKIVPTQLQLVALAPSNIDQAKPIPFTTVPIDGKAGLYRVVVQQELEIGVYAFSAAELTEEILGSNPVIILLPFAVNDRSGSPGAVTMWPWKARARRCRFPSART